MAQRSPISACCHIFQATSFNLPYVPCYSQPRRAPYEAAGYSTVVRHDGPLHASFGTRVSSGRSPAVDQCNSVHFTERSCQTKQAVAPTTDEELYILSHSFASHIEEHESCRRYEQALEAFKEAKHLELPIDVYAYKPAMSALRKLGRVKEAVALFDEMLEAGIAPNDLAYGATISAYGVLGKLDKAIDLFISMPENGVLHTSRTYNALMAACNRNSAWEKALDLYEKLRARPDIGPDVVTFQTAIFACAKGSNPDLALKLWQHLLETNIEVDRACYNSLLTALNPYPEKAHHFFIEALRAGVYPQLLKHKRDTMIDLHMLSEGAAQTALRWWLAQIAPQNKMLTVVTGWGRHRRAVDQGNVRRAVIEELKSIELPVFVSGRNIGRVLTTLGSWKHRRSRKL